MRHCFLLFLLLKLAVAGGQDIDSTQFQRYDFPGTSYFYVKPGRFQVFTNVPNLFASSAKILPNKKAILPLAAITASTLLLLQTDQNVSNGFHHFYDRLGLSSDRDYKTVVKLNLAGRRLNLYDAPRNLNSVLYSIGEGSSTLLLAGGLSLAGHIKNDYRLRQTSNELVQSMIVVGLTTQFLKYSSGRESPFIATRQGGAWHPFPSVSDFFHHKRTYDAFPSGHMATMMATVTILSENFHEKKWIRPVGYFLTGLVGVSMIANDVHWLSDYPLAIGTGYLIGHAAVKLNRRIRINQ